MDEARLGRYTILRPLAKGGMADLLLARTDGLAGFERHVVIKRIRPEQAKDESFVDMFLTEARLAASLHHTNIIQVQDIGETDGVPYFAMEYVHGEDVRQFLRVHHEAEAQVPIQHVLTIAIGVAAALHHAHEQRGPDRKPLDLVHRDVTPGNIIVGYDGNVKLVDFGIAKAISSNAAVTEVGMLKGKAPYMSPEQCSGKAADRRSDLFSLGIVLYELATVRRLFKGTTEFLTMSAIVQGRIPPPTQYRKDLPPELEAIILKALARDRARRYQTAEQLRLELDELAKQYGGASTTALNVYMKERFGVRPEPWLVDPGTEMPLIDFDGSTSGLASPPASAIDNHELPTGAALGTDAPIVRARTKSITADQASAIGRPPPVALDDVLRVGDSTAIVVPLPKPVPPAVPDDDRVDLRPRPAVTPPRRRKLAIVAGVVAIVVIAIVVIATRDGSAQADHPPLSPRATIVPEPAPRPAAVEPPVVEPVVGDAAVAPERAAAEVAVGVVDNPPPTAAPPVTRPPALTLTKKPVPTKPIAKKQPTTPITRPPPPPTWDPNALFLKKTPR